MRPDRPGFALLLSLFLVLALAVLGMGVLAVGTREHAVAAAATRRAQAERWAEAAALRAVETWSTAAVLNMAVGEVRSVAGLGLQGTAQVERIDSTLFLIRGRGAVPDPMGAATGLAGLLVRILDPGALASALPGAVTGENAVQVTGGTIDGSGVCGGPSPGVVAPAVTVSSGAQVAGLPAVQQASAGALHSVLDPARAADLGVSAVAGASITPRPLVSGGRCVADARNWGSPDPSHPCHELVPMWVASDLTVDGGEGLGILLVDGDLHVTGGAELNGVVVVRGSLQLDAGSTIRGAVRASSVITAGTVLRDECAIMKALATPLLDRAFRPPVRWWIPLF